MVKIGIVGATGLVGETIIDELEKRHIEGEFHLFASENSAGDKVSINEKEYEIKPLNEESFHGLDYALFAVGADLSKKYAPIAVENGCVVIDNSSAFRMDNEVPLIVPEVNGQQVHSHKGIIANPNCSTIQSVLPLFVLKEYGLKRVIYTTYQSVSGSGKAGIEDLERGLLGEKNQFYAVPIANNVIPQIDAFLENDYTGEEMKMVNETKKILELPELGVTATTVRVPLYSGHSVAIIAETEQPFTISAVKHKLKEMEGIHFVDLPSYPIPLDVYQTSDVHIGRVRRDDSAPNSLHIWVVADNIRKGAATNAVQILELLL